MSDDLKSAVENLSLQDKVALREYLSDMINSSRSVSQSPLRCSILMGEMAKVMGKDNGCLSDVQGGILNHRGGQTDDERPFHYHPPPEQNAGCL